MKITRVLQSTMAAVVIAGALLLAAPTAANAAVFVGVGFAPPAIPVYAQPVAPGYGYIWTPGYWAYGPDGYYWVDGDWVYPPYVGALWTPGYWGWGVGGYFWRPGYWGRSVGYYGGINYGFGYFGVGFWGGYWNGGRFFYNGAYNHLGFHNEFVYNHPVSGFDGRPGGAAFARGGAEGFNRGAEATNRGAGINGNSFANRGAEPTARTAYNGGAARGYAGGSAFASRGGYAAPQARDRRQLRWRCPHQWRRWWWLPRWRRWWTRRRTPVIAITVESRRAGEQSSALFLCQLRSHFRDHLGRVRSRQCRARSPIARSSPGSVSKAVSSSNSLSGSASSVSVSIRAAPASWKTSAFLR